MHVAHPNSWGGGDASRNRRACLCRVYGVYLIYDLAIGEQLGFTCILCQLFYERRSLATVVIGWYNRRQQDES